MTPGLHVLLPGTLGARTGGTIYDARMVAGLRQAGWSVIVHELAGRVPEADQRTRDALEGALAGIPDGARAIVDGLVAGDQPETLARHAGRLALLVLVHHPLADETGLPGPLRARLLQHERETLALADGVVVTSGFTARRVAELGVAADRVRVAVPGTDPVPPAAGPEPGAPPRLLCVGSLTERKGQDVLVRALERIGDLRWECALVGSTGRDPEFAARVRERIGAAGLGERIEIAGEVDEEALARQYARASVFVSAAWYEGYGMALAEALARGLPVVSTRGGAIAETVPEGAAALVEAGDERALAGALRELLEPANGPARRGAMAAAAREHARQLPTWPEAAAGFAAAVLALAPEGVPG